MAGLTPTLAVADVRTNRFAATTVGQAVQWQEQARLKLFELMMGGAKPQRLPLEATILQRIEVPAAGYTLEEVSFQSLPDRRVHAWLAVPKSPPGKVGAVLALHGHGGSGSQVVRGEGLYAYGRELAEMGYAIISPDIARIFHTFPTERRSVTGFDGLKREKPLTDRRSTLSPVQSACEICGLGDYFLLGTNHPTRDLDRLRLRDHGCEVINGLAELYVAARHARPKKAAACQPPIHEMFGRILAVGRNEHGMLYDWINPKTGEHSAGICDTWGYDLDGFYTVYLLDQKAAYRAAARKALGNLEACYSNYAWEGQRADGDADSIEGAINLYNREPIPSTARWIGSEMRVMWSKQRPDGVIEGWHGDGNFARTSIKYALWKTQGLHVEPWRADVRVGAVLEGGTLQVSLAADQPWKGRVRFDRPRHKDYLRLPLDYPRINQFPEWLTVAAGSRYRVKTGDQQTRTLSGRELIGGMSVEIRALEEMRLEVRPARAAR